MESVRTKAEIISERVVSTIAFRDSNVTQFPARAFTAFPRLKNLHASLIGLQEINAEAFSGVSSWVKIDLSQNSLKEIAAKTFETMTLELLDLAKNQIETIDNEAFKNANISELNLSSNKLKTATFCNNLSSFVTLYLGNNLIENFDLELKPRSKNSDSTLR